MAGARLPSWRVISKRQRRLCVSALRSCAIASIKSDANNRRAVIAEHAGITHRRDLDQSALTQLPRNALTHSLLCRFEITRQLGERAPAIDLKLGDQLMIEFREIGLGQGPDIPDELSVRRYQAGHDGYTNSNDSEVRPHCDVARFPIRISSPLGPSFPVAKTFFQCCTRGRLSVPGTSAATGIFSSTRCT